MKPLLFALAPALLLFLVGCAEEGGDARPANDAPADALSKKVEGVTGAFTRAVWSTHQNTDGSDTYINGESHHLIGFDSRDGEGVRTLIGEKGNYARPMLSPGGDTVVFTDKNVVRDSKKRKKYSPVVYALPFGSEDPPEKLAKGYAADVWRDPATGVDWVYAVRDIKTSDAGALEAKELVRFQLRDPSVEEEVWDRAPVCPDNLQLSRDGTRACGQFPWPMGGYLDFEKNDWEKLLHGCWTSYSPDDSHIAWVFDGPHRGAAMFATQTGQRWKLDLTGAPGTGRYELYHPRWTNHPRFLTLTGPYKGVEGRDIQVTRGGRWADVYIGKLDARLNRVSDWVQLTDDEMGDFYPDVWIEGGGGADLDLEKVPALAGAAAKVPTGGDAKAWPVPGGEPLFVWRDRAAKNEVAGEGGKPRQCTLSPRGLARYDRRQALAADGGWGEVDAVSAKAIEGAMGGVLGVEVLLVPGPERRDGEVVFQVGRWLLVESSGGYVLRDLELSRAVSLAKVEAGEPLHLAMQFGPEGKGMVWINGGSLEPDWGNADGIGSRLGAVTFGRGADVAISRVSVSSSAPGEGWPSEGVEASARVSVAAHDAHPAVARARVRARLAQVTPVPSYQAIQPYTRALVTYAYEDIEVLEGELEADRITVQRWGVMDKELVPGMPAQVGETHELVLEPLDAHPELEGERAEDDILDFAAPSFYQVGITKP